jgi:subtilisin family serine protease
MGGTPGSSNEGPKEGDIKLRDNNGHWYLVEGIPTNPKPYTAQSVTVAVIDSGVTPEHPQIKGLIAEQKDFTGEGLIDRIGHGTLVTIIMQAPLAQLSKTDQANLPNSRIIQAKVANADGTIDKNAVIYAIQWAAGEGARLVNMSLGFREGTDDYSGLCDIIAKYPQIMFILLQETLDLELRYFRQRAPLTI